MDAPPKRRGEARRRSSSRLQLAWLREEYPGSVWSELLDRTWPAYRRWFLREGDDRRPDLSTCRTELQRHMPELVPTWERLVELAEGDETVARMLSLVDPAPYLAGCSQAVWLRGRRQLVRNYDYRPEAFEGVFLLSRWQDTLVLASSDCLWGALDGVNEHGLSVALAFGGRRVVGPGFGIPLIVRYVLETCRTVSESAHVLRRVPSHMAYNVSLLDAAGAYAVAYVAPDRPTEVVSDQVCTNHYPGATLSEYARVTRSEERYRHLEEQLTRRQSADRFVDHFLRPPLYAGDHDRGYRTLYTVSYRPASGSAEYRWPNSSLRQSFDAFRESELAVEIG